MNCVPSAPCRSRHEMFVGGADRGSYARRQRSSSTRGSTARRRGRRAAGARRQLRRVDEDVELERLRDVLLEGWSWACTVGSDSGVDELRRGGSRRPRGAAVERRAGRAAAHPSVRPPRGTRGSGRRREKRSAPPSSDKLRTVSCNFAGRRAADPSRQSRMGRGRARWRLEVQAGFLHSVISSGKRSPGRRPRAPSEVGDVRSPTGSPRSPTVVADLI